MSTPTTALPVTEQPATTPRTMQAVVFDDFGATTIVAAVIHMTISVPRSAAELLLWKAWSWVQRERSWVCMRNQ